MNWISKNRIILGLILFLVCLQIPSLTVFFSADDWYHLRVSNIDSLNEFVNFFKFTKNEQSISFYRPLPTQVFFFVLYKIFQLNPIPYHLIVILTFGLTLYFIFLLARLLFKNNQAGLLTVLFYGLASSNQTRIYFLSHYQEVLMSLLVFSGLYFYLKGKSLLATILYLLALMSKETAVVFPFLIFLFSLNNLKKRVLSLGFISLLTLVYLYFRFSYFGLATGDSYSWSFSVGSTLNSLFWYITWSLGAPELLLDYIGSMLIPISKFYSDFSFWPLIIFPLLILVIMCIFLFFKSLSKITVKPFIYASAFLVSLLPFLFMPSHKFAVSLGVPLLFFDLILVWLIIKNTKYLYLFIFLFILLNVPMGILNSKRHYSVGRSSISKSVYEFVKTNYPVQPKDSYLEFVNDTPIFAASWGSSRQISNSIQGSEMFRLIYDASDYQVYYEDDPGERPNTKKISVSTKQFIK